MQVLHQGQPWDTHKNNNTGNREICRRTDGPTAALLTDLKQRGLLDDTLVIWGGEFGRTPMAEGKDGRDHHKFGFSLWLAGGGVNPDSPMARRTNSVTMPQRNPSTWRIFTRRSCICRNRLQPAFV